MLTTYTNFAKYNETFFRHTKRPQASDYELAKAVLQAAMGKGRKQYLQECINYLFFFKCLPDDFHNKWTQVQSGDFEFNVTFFSLLRTNCTVLNKDIYGDIGYWDGS